MDLFSRASISNTGTGTALQSQGQSVGTFIASASGGLVAVPERERTAPVDPGLWQWLKPVFKTSTNDFLQKCGLDAYFFLRYLLALLKIFVPLAFVIIPILIPLNYTGGGGLDASVTGLDKLTVSNISKEKSKRLWAHCMLAILLVIWVCYVVFSELRRYIRIRQSYLTSPQHRLRASATTVLVRSIPPKWLTLEALAGLFDVFPGGLRNIWINRNYDDLTELIERRDKFARTLEGAETELIEKCVKASKKQEKGKENLPLKSNTGFVDGPGEGISSGNPHQVHHTVEDALNENTKRPSTSDSEANARGGGSIRQKSNKTSTEQDPKVSMEDENPEYDEGALWKQYIKEKDRDTLRLPILKYNWMPGLPLIGKKVDTIYYCRKEVARLNVEIEKLQAQPDNFPLMNSAFVQFNNQAAAHMACQSVSHHMPKQMTPRIVEISPNDVVWDNMSLPWWQQYIRSGGIVLVVIGMILLWAVPIAFSGSLSQISTIRKTIPWLGSWLGKAPTWVISVVQGILPIVVLALLMIILPLILRFLVKLQGIPTGMLIELTVQRYYFCFQFVQIFLVVSISSAFTTLINLIETATKQNTFDVSTIPEVLAKNIPKASNYFLSYMLLQSLSVSGGALVQIATIFKVFILAPFKNDTARNKFKTQTALPQIKWGTFYPAYTTLACIGLIYSVLSPIILIFNIVTFSLFWVVYRYNTLFVYQYTIDTGGLLFPKALNQTFTGLYIMELVLIGYFLVVEAASDDQGLAGPVIIMFLTILGTAGFQFLLNDAFGPLFRYLPITLEDDAVARDEEFARIMAERYDGHNINEPSIIKGASDDKDIDEVLAEEERESLEENQAQEAYEMEELKRKRQKEMESDPTSPLHSETPEQNPPRTKSKRERLNPRNLMPPHHPTSRSSWADRDPARRSSSFGKNEQQVAHSHSRTKSRPHVPQQIMDPLNFITREPLNFIVGADQADIEAQRAGRNKLTELLFSGINDELEDLTPEQRDALVQRAFLHSALRSKRPVIWIPRDHLGVSDDEIARTRKASQKIWISNEKQGLDEKGRCVFNGAPPDFDEVDLIQL
ncbi:MAG: hypothetical protein M1834_003728 [Cirrosporium novae-zelandiae]|nr:MAG: hypothetical protein M1834_003728 [Cirrosporium novae-zelandiae]